VVISLWTREQTEELLSVPAAIDDAKHLRVIEETAGEFGIRQGTDEFEFDPLERCEKALRVGDDLAGTSQTDLKVGLVVPNRRLSRGAKNRSCVIVVGEFLKDAQTGRKEIDRKSLRLVEDDDGIGDVVELSRPRGFCGKE